MAILLAERAENALKTNPGGSPEAQQLVRRAIGIVDSISQPEKTDSGPGMEDRESSEAMKRQREIAKEKLLPYLRQLERQASGKK